MNVGSPQMWTHFALMLFIRRNVLSAAQVSIPFATADVTVRVKHSSTTWTSSLWEIKLLQAG